MIRSLHESPGVDICCRSNSNHCSYTAAHFIPSNIEMKHIDKDKTCRIVEPPLDIRSVHYFTISTPRPHYLLQRLASRVVGCVAL